MCENPVESIFLNRLKEIDNQIDFAFKHKAVLAESDVEFQPDGKTASKVDLGKARAFSKEVKNQIARGADPEDFDLEATHKSLDHQIQVSESHLYPVLLKKVLKKAIEETESVYPDTWIDEKVDKILEHEYLHAVPGLDNQELSITYGVSVFRDDVQGGITIQPYIGLNGRLSLLMHKDIVSNTNAQTRSAIDKELLDWDN